MAVGWEASRRTYYYPIYRPSFYLLLYLSGLASPLFCLRRRVGHNERSGPASAPLVSPAFYQPVGQSRAQSAETSLGFHSANQRNGC